MMVMDGGQRYYCHQNMTCLISDDSQELKAKQCMCEIDGVESYIHVRLSISTMCHVNATNFESYSRY